MSPRGKADVDAVPAPPTSAEIVAALASGDDEQLRALAQELGRLASKLDAATAPDLTSMIDRAVAAVLARGSEKNDKGEYHLGAREIDAATKWYLAKMRMGGGGGGAEDDTSGFGSALGTGETNGTG